MRLPVDNAIITSWYGWRELNGARQFHDGIDFISRENNIVYSIADGICSYDFDNYDEAKKLTDGHHSGGNMVIIDYEFDGQLYHIRFLHLGKNQIKQKEKIVEGQIIGWFANVGISFGAHLHNDAYDANWKKINIEELYKNLKLL